MRRLLFFLVLVTQGFTLTLHAQQFRYGDVYIRFNNVGGNKYGIVVRQFDYDKWESIPYKGDIVIPESVMFDNTIIPVTAIGEQTFADSPELTSVVIPSSVVDVPDYRMFENSPNLVKVVIGVPEIGSCFEGVTSLKEAILSEGVISLNSSFKGCTSLEKVTLPKSLQRIGGESFADCPSLTQLEIPENVVEVDFLSLGETTNVTSLTINARDVGNWFSSYSTFKEVVFGDSVKSVSASALGTGKGMTVTLGKSIKSFGWKGGESVDRLIINSEAIGEGWFEDWLFKEATFGSSVTSIGKRAFSGCLNFNNIVLPEGLKSIGEAAFSGCPMKTITLPNSVENLGESIFLNCRNLSEVKLMQGIKEIPARMFNSCSSLEHFDIPSTVVSIGNDAFAWSSISEMIIPETVKVLGIDLFSHCKKLTTLTLPSSWQTIPEGLCLACTSLKSIDLPSGITHIGQYAFESCRLQQLDLPNGIKYIDRGAFDGNSFTELVLPSSVERLEKGAFGKCNKLTTVYAQMTTPCTLDWTFRVSENSLKKQTLYVPTGCKQAYIDAGWNNEFYYIKENEANSIKATTFAKGSLGEPYDLSGRRTKKLSKGLYLIGNKKVLITK